MKLELILTLFALGQKIHVFMQGGQISFPLAFAKAISLKFCKAILQTIVITKQKSR